jgi:two-component system osmolarity sensor histidine kinase EnvZ
MLRDVVRASGASIQVRLSPTPAIDCRPVALRRALANLVENALRYGREVEVRSASQPSRDGGRIVLSILDRGPGIPEAEIAHMRQPFTRLDAARGGKPGAGLGLAIVERIARLHQGELILRNREGGGLEAVLSLPVTEFHDGATK